VWGLLALVAERPHPATSPTNITRGNARTIERDDIFFTFPANDCSWRDTDAAGVRGIHDQESTGRLTARPLDVSSVATGRSPDVVNAETRAHAVSAAPRELAIAVRLPPCVGELLHVDAPDAWRSTQSVGDGCQHGGAFGRIFSLFKAEKIGVLISDATAPPGNASIANPKVATVARATAPREARRPASFLLESSARKGARPSRRTSYRHGRLLNGKEPRAARHGSRMPWRRITHVCGRRASPARRSRRYSTVTLFARLRG
jgi:hypothetical protein